MDTSIRTTTKQFKKGHGGELELGIDFIESIGKKEASFLLLLADFYSDKFNEVWNIIVSIKIKERGIV